LNCQVIKYNAIVLLGITFFTTCTIYKNVDKIGVTKPLPKENFISNPFGYEASIKNFTAHLPSSYKLQVYTTKNKFYPKMVDSIFRFYHKKTELFIYKTYSKRELFVGGNIYDSRITLQNGIKVAINRDDFFKCFNDLKHNTLDTIRMVSKHAGTSYNFVFKHDKLKAIKIDNNID